MASSLACFVLIPAPTLEDIPNRLADSDARSLLAAWTVMWHPLLVNRCRQLPQWHRADAPPEKADLLVVPNLSVDQLPSGYADQMSGSDTIWVTGNSRQEMETQMLQEFASASDQFPSLDSPARRVDVNDFYAAGFAYLQIQLMTRRLRYTSNLDEVHLENQLVEAATAFLDRHVDQAVAAMHGVFDALAEERDHYFASDPHLIDLTLVNKTTLDTAINHFVLKPSSTADDTLGGNHPHPRNVLLDSSAINRLADRSDDSATRLKTLLRDHDVTWVGGAPGPEIRFDQMSYASSAHAIEQTFDQATQCIGAPPRIYGRLDGDTPSDLIDLLAQQGYLGVVPINFAAGSGHERESKVTVPTQDGSLEALTAKPIDAASDASFVNLGARLGEAIDGGEVATGLLVHWPGSVCDSFNDLVRTASWSLALGKFWSIEDYFVSGEKPYHQGSLSITSSAAAAMLDQDVEAAQVDPISSHANRFRLALLNQRDEFVVAMEQLVNGFEHADVGQNDTKTDKEDSTAPPDFALSSLAGSIGAVPTESASVCLVVNTHSSPVRMTTRLPDSSFPDDWSDAKHLFAATRGQRATVDATIDTPALGYAIVGKGIQAEPSPKSPSPGKPDALSGASPWSWLRDRFLGKPATIASQGALHNEFMEAVIDSETGALASVFSGGLRGNRYSMRLVAVGASTTSSKGKSSDAKMRCDSLKILDSTAAIGKIQATGTLIDDDQELADFQIVYSLQRGSRVVDIDIELTPKIKLADQPWQSYFAARSAVADESAIVRSFIRDRTYQLSRRKLVSPLGLLIDEAERKTLVCGHGAPYHRVIDPRFCDTLLCVRGETNTKSKLSIGFDVPQPLTTAKSLMSPPIVRQVEVNSSTVSSGWFVHLSPAHAIVESLKVHPMGDGRFAAEVRVIQTIAKPCKAKLRFFRDVAAALIVKGDCQKMLKQWSDGTDKFSENTLEISGNTVELSLASHSVLEVVVIFR